jgi:hypothetical protein
VQLNFALGFVISWNVRPTISSRVGGAIRENATTARNVEGIVELEMLGPIVDFVRRDNKDISRLRDKHIFWVPILERSGWRH